MSFCIRSISNGSRYVPTFVASAQGCTARRFSSRQLPRHVKPVTSSMFLNEFLGTNSQLISSLDTRDYKLSNGFREASTNTQAQPSPAHVNHLLDCSGSNDINCDDGINQIPNNENYELFSQEISQISYTNSTGDHLVLFNNLKPYENQIPVTGGENSWSNINHRTNFTDVGTCTKDRTKVKFSTVSKTAPVLKQRTTDTTSTTKTNKGKPSDDGLERVYQTLSADLPTFFVRSIDYRIYHPQIEFVNNIRGTTTKGLYDYVKQMALLRIVGHIKFAYVRLEVLKITMHTQDNTVRVRWRINGITGMKAMFSFWKFKFWKIRESLREQEVWHDGFSTFYVGDDGLVYKHVADKMMPDEEVDEVKPKAGIPSKLAPQLTFSSLEFK